MPNWGGGSAVAQRSTRRTASGRERQVADFESCRSSAKSERLQPVLNGPSSQRTYLEYCKRREPPANDLASRLRWLRRRTSRYSTLTTAGRPIQRLTSRDRQQ